MSLPGSPPGQRFVCWKDSYDLTERLEQAANASPSDVVVFEVQPLDDAGVEAVVKRVERSPRGAPIMMSAEPDALDDAQTAQNAAHLAEAIFSAKREQATAPTAPWRYVVDCPQDKERNVFSSAVASRQPANATIVGTRPTTADDVWIEAAKEIVPEKSLTRASDSARWVVSSISIVALALGGFGLFTDLGGGFDEHPWALGIPVGLAAAALGCAVWSLFPQIAKRLNYNNLAQVESEYEKAIRHRANWARAATGLLLAALIAAFVGFLIARTDTRDPMATITTTWDGSGQQGILDITVDMKNLQKTSAPTVALYGITPSGKKAEPTRLSAAVGAITTAGSAKVDEKLVPAKGYGSFRVDVVVNEDGKAETIESTTFTPPPFALPPAAGSTSTGGATSG